MKVGTQISVNFLFFVFFFGFFFWFFGFASAFPFASCFEIVAQFVNGTRSLQPIHGCLVARTINQNVGVDV